MSSRALITGISGLELRAADLEWIRAELPVGFVLFRRNINKSPQASSIIREFRVTASVGDAPVRIAHDGTMAAAIVRAAFFGLKRFDFAAFHALADPPTATTTHVVFSASDPAHRATTSATIINQVIRGVIGFQGLVMSGDVSMKALAVTIAERTRAIVNAACDLVWHGNGKLGAKRGAARETSQLTGAALLRARRAASSRHQPKPFGRLVARVERDALINRAGTA
jgi:beta-glucosidase-like glycosyl hydrolase